MTMLEYIHMLKRKAARQEIEKMFNCDDLRPLFNNVDSYVDRLIKALEEQYVPIFDAWLALKTRLIIRSPPLELGVPWDPQWNLPYIPAAMIRDALQSAAGIFTKCIRVNDFGTLEKPSSIVVLDAYPIQCPYGCSLVTVDYIEKEGVSELDELERLPVLAVSSNTAFRIVLLVKKGVFDCTEDKLFDEVYRLVKITLGRGIGMLTSLGYGTFDVGSM